MIRTLIVDDEELARYNVRQVLAAMEGVEVVGEAGHGAGAVAAIDRLDPDLIFLDVQMPGRDGFQVIEDVGVELMPPVIFVTAFDEHAVRAFSVHAFDFVLKPFEDERLREAVRHAGSRFADRERGRLGHRLESLLADFRALDPATAPGEAFTVPGGSYASRILVRDRDRAAFVPVADIRWIGAAGNYVKLHVEGRRTHIVRMALSALEQRLDPARFMRVHRSAIVNLERVTQIHPWVGGDHIAVLDDGQEIRVSRTYRDTLLRPLL